MALKPMDVPGSPFAPQTCSPLPRGDGAETRWSTATSPWMYSLAVPFHGAMALKLGAVAGVLGCVVLAVPFHGAMALKRLDVMCKCAGRSVLQSPSTGRWR